MHSANFSTLQRIFMVLGTVGLVISCLMTAKFGAAMSWLHAVALVSVTVMAAFVFPARTYLREMGLTTPAKVFGILGCFFVALEFYSHLGYTVGMRNKATLEASVQTAAYKNTQDSLASEKQNLEFWRKQLTDLKDQNAWTATVTASGLRAQLDLAEKAIKDEAARRGCKSKCEARMREKADLESRIATAEKVEDLTTRIEATQRILDGKTEKAVSTKTGFSAAAAQTDWMGKIYLLAIGTDAEAALSPDQVTLTVTDIVIGFFIALGATVLPTSAFYLAFVGKKLSDEVPAAVREVAHEAKDAVNSAVYNFSDRDALKVLADVRNRIAGPRLSVGAAA